jgi:protein transport protein SEC24
MVYDTRVLGAYPPPPSAASRYIVRDKGIAGPRFIRSTLSQVPHSSELTGYASMPFSVFVSPLALPEPQDDPVQVRPIRR